jgi:hypothetical protein
VTAHNDAMAERLRFSETAVRNDVSIMKQKYRLRPHPSLAPHRGPGERGTGRTFSI